MKKRYPFLPKNWLRFGLAAAFAASLSLNLNAQNAPAKQWDKTFGGSNMDVIRVIEQTADGGYILGGYSDSNISSDKSQASKGVFDYWVVKLDVNGNKQWDKTLGGNNADYLTCLQQTSDGGYILGGQSYSGISGDKTEANRGPATTMDYWIVKIDANGNKLWDKTFGGFSLDGLNAVQQTSDGGYILGGASLSTINGDKTQSQTGYWIVKTDMNGIKQWDKTFGGNRSDALLALKVTADGGYILGGGSNSDISGDKSQPCQGGNDFWVVKLDGNGNKVWDKTLGGSNSDDLFSLQQTADGGFILGGYSSSNVSGDKSQPSIGNKDYWVIKLNANGNKVWDKSFGGTGEDYLRSLHQTSDGGFILGGFSDSGISIDKSQASLGTKDFWIVKINPIGNKVWDKTLGGSLPDELYSLKHTTDGGYVLAGFSDSGISSDKSDASKGSSDYWVIKLAGSPTGLKEPEATFNLSIYPNPSQGKFNLQLSNLAAPKAEVTVSDQLGRVVLQKELQTNNNQIQEELALSTANGIYLLRLKAGEQIITRKIVIE